MVKRRGKEHEGGKKKKRPTKLKRIILKERSERKEAEERDKAAANAEDDGGKEIEVTVEVGRVYVNLLVSEDAVGVDLLYLEDEDEEVEENAADEEDAAMPASKLQQTGLLSITNQVNPHRSFGSASS